MRARAQHFSSSSLFVTTAHTGISADTTAGIGIPIPSAIAEQASQLPALITNHHDPVPKGYEGLEPGGVS